MTTVATRLPPPRTDPRAASGVWVGLAAAASMVVVIGLWLGHGGLAGLAQPASGLTSLGRLTGLLSADLLLIQVILMARVPWVERAFGQDQLAHWHRSVGFWSVNLLLAHIVAITIGYAGTSHVDLLRQAWDLVTTYPGMLLATAAAGLLGLVAVTSVRAARRRLRYESWHLLHLYAYLGVGLAIPHELWTGTDFLSSSVATAYWWTLYAVAAGCVLLFRIGIPLGRSLYHRIEVEAVVPEAPGVVSVWLRGQRLHELPVRAGQFFHWRFLGVPGWTRAHPYSLSAAPRPDRLRITVKELGDGSELVSRLRPGTRVLFEGPYGGLTEAVRLRPKLTMLASGIGITPLRALLEELPYARGEATLIYRARTDQDFAFRSELSALAAHRGVRTVYLPGPRAGAHRWAPAGTGGDDALLHTIVADIADQDVFVCGPAEWMQAAVASARRLGTPPEHIHVERFDW